MTFSGLKSLFTKFRSRAHQLYNHWYFEKYRNMPVEQVFNNIYQRNQWKSGASRSGPGSHLAQTSVIRKELPRLWQRFEIKSILDIPCGDWNWMKYVELKDMEYHGGDIVAPIIHKNRRIYEAQGVTFSHMNILSDELPCCDLILCRDCLVHFSYGDIARALFNMYRSGSDYLLTTTFQQKHNLDMITGAWRPVNLMDRPFYLPSPILIINENCTEGKGKYQDKSLALWRLKSLGPEIERILAVLA